jgi:hypothetical protein
MTMQFTDAERKSKLKELLESGETDLNLYDGLLPDNALGDVLRVSLKNRREDDERRDYILSVLEQHGIRPDEVHRLCRS